MVVQELWRRPTRFGVCRVAAQAAAFTRPPNDAEARRVIGGMRQWSAMQRVCPCGATCGRAKMVEGVRGSCLGAGATPNWEPSTRPLDSYATTMMATQVSDAHVAQSRTLPYGVLRGVRTASFLSVYTGPGGAKTRPAVVETTAVGGMVRAGAVAPQPPRCRVPLSHARLRSPDACGRCVVSAAWGATPLPHDHGVCCVSPHMQGQ